MFSFAVEISEEVDAAVLELVLHVVAVEVVVVVVVRLNWYNLSFDYGIPFLLYHLFLEVVGWSADGAEVAGGILL